MRIVVTGAGGFVGRALVRDLARHHEVVALDQRVMVPDGLQNVFAFEGNLADPGLIAAAIADGCDAVIHLATTPGGAAEQDPHGAWEVNMNATAALIDAVVGKGNRPRFFFASSIAVLGDPLPTYVDDATPLRPRMLYGAHKAMMEQWIATMSRRGTIAGLSLRLSGIVARPLGPSGMKSAFMSNVFHAALAGEPFVSPVSADATMWMMSLERIVRNFRHAVEVAEIQEPYAVTLPAVRLSMSELVAEIATQTGWDLSQVSYAPDASLEAGFGRFPLLHSQRARDMGFCDDGSPAALVRAALDRIRQGD